MATVAAMRAVEVVRRAALALLAALAVTLGLAVVTAGPAHAAAACLDRGGVGVVNISTLPAVPGLTVKVDGKPITLSSKGTGEATTCRSQMTDRLVVPLDAVPLDDRRQVRYDKMFVTSGGSLVTLAFQVDYLTEVRLNGLPSADIDSFALRSSTGQRIDAEKPDPLWLWGSRVVRGPSGLQLRDIYYTIDSVFAYGSSVVNRSQTKFYPRKRATVDVSLLTYTVEFEVRDRLFGFPIGRTAYLTAADGTLIELPLTKGRATRTALPRGSYIASVDAPALSVSRPVSISKDQTVDLPVLTYVDIAVLLGVPLASAITLILAPRPALRARLVPRRTAAVTARAFRALGRRGRHRQHRPRSRDLARPLARRGAGPNRVSTPALDEEAVSTRRSHAVVSVEQGGVLGE